MKHEVVLTMMCSLMLANFFVGSAFSRLENPIVSIYPFYPAKAYVGLPVVVGAEVITSRS